MRFNSLGQGVHGTTKTYIDGVIVPSLAAATSDRWRWLSDTIIMGQATFGSGYSLYQVIVSPDTLSTLAAGGANSCAAGNNVWAAWASGVSVRTSVTGFGPFPAAALGDVSPDGIFVFVANYQAGAGVTTFAANGSALSNVSVQLVGGTSDGTNLLRARDGVYAYRDSSSNHLRSVVTGALQSYAPRTATVFQTVPVKVSGVMWVVEVTDALSIRPATSSNGFVLTTDDTFNVDAVEVSAGVLRVGWSSAAGETSTNLRMADVTVATGGLSTGTTASGSLVFTAAPDLTQNALPVGPLEGGSLTAMKQPRFAYKDEAWKDSRTMQAWLDKVAGQAFAPANLSQATGTLPPAQGGTGTTTGLSVINGANVVGGTTQLFTAQAPGTIVLETGYSQVMASPIHITGTNSVILRGTAQLRLV